MTFVPRPVLTFAVGVVGHRLDKLANVGATKSRLREVYDIVDRVCERQFQDAGETYAPNLSPLQPVWRVRLMTGFAEGAGQIAAAAAPGAWEIEALLPAPIEIYLTSFAAENSSDGTDRRQEFKEALRRAGERIVELPAVNPRKARGAVAPTAAEQATAVQASYARQAEFLLKQIDVLIAVWDGELSEERGRTGDTVMKALRGGVPVVWIPADGTTAPVFLEEADDLDGDTFAAFEAPLGAAIARLVRPPPRDAHDLDAKRGERPARQRLNDFLFKEVEQPRCCWTAYEMLKRSFVFQAWSFPIQLPDLEAVRAHWRPFLDEAPRGKDFRQRLEMIVLPRYYAADHVATRLSHVYRSAYVLSYLFAILAVFAAALEAYLVTPNTPNEYLYKTPFVVLGLAFTFGILLYVFIGRSRDWHGRWLDARALAERLRHIRALALVGECEVVRDDAEISATGAKWTSWYLRATIRELGVPYGSLDADFQAKALNAARDYERKEQIDFNQSNQRELTALNFRLRDVGERTFILSALFLFILAAAMILNDLGLAAVESTPRSNIPFRLAGLPGWLEPFQNFIGGFLPALGAAIAGVRATGDFDGFAERSRETRIRLASLHGAYERALERREFDLTAHTIAQTVRILEEDLSDWRSLYARKKPSLS